MSRTKRHSIAQSFVTAYPDAQGTGSPSKVNQGLTAQPAQSTKHERRHSCDPGLDSVASNLFPPCQRYSLERYSFGDFQGVALLDSEHAVAIPETSPKPKPIALPDIFMIAHTGSHGYGMIAQECIQPGSLILAEYPVVIVPNDVSPMSDMNISLSRLLPPAIHQDFMKLMNCWPFDYGKLEGIIRTNSLRIELSAKGVKSKPIYRGVFLQASRCNHSCSPNARWQWDSETFCLVLEAVQAIRRGEEITIHYVAIDRPRHERRAQLRVLYNFDCTCHSCCVASPQAMVLSDRARLRLSRFWEDVPAFEKWCLDLSMPDDWLIRAHQDAIRLLGQEGLEVLGYEKHIDVIAMCYGALCDAERFRTWVRRVQEMRVARHPEQSPVFKKWIGDPTSFHVWGWRKRLQDLVSSGHE